MKEKEFSDWTHFREQRDNGRIASGWGKRKTNPGAVALCCGTVTGHHMALQHLAPQQKFSQFIPSPWEVSQA